MKWIQSREEINQRLDCIVEVWSILQKTWLAQTKNQDEATIHKRTKTPLPFDIYSSEQKKQINQAIDCVNNLFEENDLPVMPVTYKREV